MSDEHHPRIIVRIELTEPALENLQGATERNGMTQVAMLSRLVQWFAGQPDMVRAAVLGLIPPKAGEDAGTTVIKQLLTR